VNQFTATSVSVDSCNPLVITEPVVLPFAFMQSLQIARLRSELGISRADMARFVGVSEATVVRWESRKDPSEPHGLQAVLLRAIADAASGHPVKDIARMVRLSGASHADAMITLLDAAG